MDEKTAELRDIFVETTGADTVTERQKEGPGALADDEERPDAAERLPELVAAMRERYAFAAGLDDDEYVRVVRAFFAGEDDDAIADALDVAPETVFTARLDLHLVRESDREAPFPLADLRELVVDGVPLDERADRLGVDVDTAAHYSQVVHADRRSTRANDRFRDEFAELLTDRELEQRHAEDAHEDGLREAAEDIETNVSF